jgi:hypothetical protein
MDLATRKMVYYGLLGLLVAGSTIAVFQVAPQVFHTTILPKDGTLSIYLTNIQPDISGNQMISSSPLQLPPTHASGKPSLNLLSLNVTIDSVTIHETNDSNDNGRVISNTRFSFDVLRPFNVSQLITKAELPAENVAMVDLHVTGAMASVQGLGLQTVRVPSDVLKIPVSPAVNIRAQMSSSIVISGTAHIVFQGNGGIILTPVLHVEKTTEPH